MAQFVEGELAVLQNASYFEEWNGALALVIGGWALRHPLDMYTMNCDPMPTYRVQPLVAGAIVVNCQPHQLRKLPGSRDDREDLQTDKLITSSTRCPAETEESGLLSAS